MTRPLARFTVRPEIGPAFFTIMVWPSVKAMRAATDTDDAYAVCITKTHACKQRGMRHTRVAVIHLARPKLKTDIVAHEVFHAILQLARHKRILPAKLLTDQREERLSYALSDTVDRITRKLKKLGFA